MTHEIRDLVLGYIIQQKLRRHRISKLKCLTLLLIRLSNYHSSVAKITIGNSNMVKE